MTPAARIQLARDLYLAFADGDRELVESRLAEVFTFSSPVDVGLDRGTGAGRSCSRLSDRR
jgi:hypothetical protein